MGMFNKVTIIGDGAMGSVCSMLLCNKNVKVIMWGYDAAQLAEIAEGRENVRFLPGHKLPEQLVFDSQDDKILADAELIVSAVPCQYMRGVWERLKSFVPQEVPIVSAAKGIENETLLRPTEIHQPVFPCFGPRKYWLMFSGRADTQLFRGRQ